MKLYEKVKDRYKRYHKKRNQKELKRVKRHIWFKSWLGDSHMLYFIRKGVSFDFIITSLKSEGFYVKKRGFRHLLISWRDE